MKTTLTLIESYKILYSDKVSDTRVTKIFIFSESRKIRGEKNCFRSTSYGITVRYYIGDDNYFFIDEIYNMVIGKKYMSRRIKYKVSEMIENKEFTKHKYYSEYWKRFAETEWKKDVSSMHEY